MMVRKEAVIAILGSPVAYYAAFAKVLGGVEAGILTSQFFYWYGKGHNPDGWIYKTQAEIEDETGLSRRNQETARKKLRESGVLEEKYSGMPAKLFYRLNLERLFALMNEWYTSEIMSEEEFQAVDGADSPSDNQDVRIRHPWMRESAIQGCANPPSKDVRTRHPRMREPAIQGCTDAPSMDGGFRHTNTETTTKTTTEITTKTTTPTATRTRGDLASTADSAVDVSVAVLHPNTPDWLLEEFQLLLGSDRRASPVDLAALCELSTFPEHIIHQAIDASHAWLEDRSKGPIRSLARWLVGTAQRKQDAEQTRGSEVSSVANGALFEFEETIPRSDTQDGSEEPFEPVEASPEQKLWSTVLQELEMQIPAATYEPWVRGTWIISTNGDEYVIGMSDGRAKDWLENRLAHGIQRTLSSLVGHPVAVRFQEP
jgi:hypothetical protein